MKGQSGEVDVIIIPIDKNQLIKGEKGVYLNLAMFEIKNKTTESKDTHIIKQGFKKEITDSMSEDQKKELPILGNATVWQEKRSETINELKKEDQGIIENIVLPF